MAPAQKAGRAKADFQFRDADQAHVLRYADQAHVIGGIVATTFPTFQCQGGTDTKAGEQSIADLRSWCPAAFK
eukprot:gene31667-26208_t